MLQLDHLAFPCADAAATLRFHVEVMGFTLAWAARTEERLTMTFQIAGGPTLGYTCHRDARPLPPVSPRGDAPHVGLLVADAGERAQWKRRLTEQRVPFTVEDEGPEERIYVADPNGVVFEIEAASPPPSQSPPEALEIVRGWSGVAERRALAVGETFFSVSVSDMERATAFYVAALGATVAAATPGWSSLHIAGVRVGLALDPQHAPTRTGLHFAVGDLAAARAAVERAGGRAPAPPIEVAPGVVIAEVIDSEANRFTLVQR